jgi:hypothetical protein
MTIERLENLPDYAVRVADCDIRGWRLHDREGRPLGRIEDLIVDTEACRVTEAIAHVRHHDVLVPIGALALDEAAQIVNWPFGADELSRLPEYQYSRHPREQARLSATFLPGSGLEAPLSSGVRDMYRSGEPRIERLEQIIRGFREG